MQVSQSDIIKVTKHVIDPIKRHWNADFDKETIEDFISDLAKYSAENLGDAMRELRRESKSKPRLAHVVELCRKQMPKPKTAEQQQAKTFHCLEHAEKGHPRIAEEILKSATGQLALKHGVGRELLNAYECTGKKEFTEDDVRSFYRGQQKAVAALRETDTKKNPQHKYWEGVFDQMRQREKRLYEAYYQQGANA